jgi:hypothetical protein
VGVLSPGPAVVGDRGGVDGLVGLGWEG